MKRKGPLRKRARTAHSRRVRSHFLNIDGGHVEADLKYWAVHATHWMYMIFAVVAFLVVVKN